MNQKVSGVMNDGWGSFREALLVQRKYKTAFAFQKPFLACAYNRRLKEALEQSAKFENQKGGIAFFKANELHRRFRILNEAGYARSVIARTSVLWKYVDYSAFDQIAVMLISEAEARVNVMGIVKKRKSGEDDLEKFMAIYRTIFQLPISSRVTVCAYESRARVLERFGRNVAAKDQRMRAARIALRGGMVERGKRIIAEAREKLVA